jgi:hypothetical protein
MLWRRSRHFLFYRNTCLYCRNTETFFTSTGSGVTFVDRRLFLSNTVQRSNTFGESSKGFAQDIIGHIDLTD